jgi:hypothetical protein
MRQGAQGAWLFHIPYTPDEHPGTLFFLLHLLLGKIARLLPGDDLTMRMVVVYHLARVVFGMGLVLSAYRFLAALTEDVSVRRLAWWMVAMGGGLGWLLTALGQIRWLGDVPLDLYFPEGFAFIALYGFPHVAAAQSLLLLGILCLLRAWGGAAGATNWHSLAAGLPTRRRTGDSTLGSVKWAALTGLVWILMGLIAPFYVVVAWAIAGAAWLTLCVRRQPGFAIRCREASMVTLAALISTPVVAYSGWVFTIDPVYGVWAAQNQITSPNPIHYLAAYGMPLALAAFAIRDAWRDETRAWLAVSWLAVVPLLVYLPVNLQLRLATGVQVPLSLLAAQGAVRLWNEGRRWMSLSLLALMTPTSVFLLVSSTVWIIGRPSPSFRDAAEILALDWLAKHSQVGDIVLTTYESGSYLPARASVGVLVGHDLEVRDAEKKRHLIERFFDATEDNAWRQRFLAQYGVDYILWGPAERGLGSFDPSDASCLRQAYGGEAYAVFEVE